MVKVHEPYSAYLRSPAMLRSGHGGEDIQTD